MFKLLSMKLLSRSTQTRIELMKFMKTRLLKLFFLMLTLGFLGGCVVAVEEDDVPFDDDGLVELEAEY